MDHKKRHRQAVSFFCTPCRIDVAILQSSPPKVSYDQRTHGFHYPHRPKGDTGIVASSGVPLTSNGCCGFKGTTEHQR